MAITFRKSFKKHLADGQLIRKGEPLSLQKVEKFKGFLQCYFEAIDPFVYDSMVFLGVDAGPGLVMSGRAAIKDIPLVALDKRYHFNKYIFVESNEQYYDALNLRIRKLPRFKSSFLFRGTLAQHEERLSLYMPGSSRGYKAKTLLYSNISDFGFNLNDLAQLKDQGCDCLLIIDPLNVPDRKLESYVGENGERILQFCHDESVFSHMHSTESFYRHVVRAFLFQMQKIGFDIQGMFQKDGDNLWYTGLFTVNQSKKKIARSVEKTNSSQYNLFA